MICFHNPEENNGYLSNWYLSEFTVDDIRFSSMEQYMMYEKAVLFHDKETAEKILRTDDVAETGEDVIAECAVKDCIWGIGLSMKDEDRFCVGKWKGQNLLGQILMRVREEIRHQKKEQG